MRANIITGQVPQQLCLLSKLHVLDLAANNISGSIPPCVGTLAGFSSVSTEEPASVMELDALFQSTNDSLYTKIEMDLVQKGKIYKYSATLKLLNSFDLSSNYLSGGIPEEIANFSLLRTLNLSHNQLSGMIPEEISRLHLLETLDVSCNHLLGSIPPSMSSMTALNSLNVSHNNLSGPIPSTNQFQTFHDPSIYEGNQQLCGAPLLTKCRVPCDVDTGFKRKEPKGNSQEDWYEDLGLYISIVLGFVMGFWAVCGSLIIKESWRHALFGFVGKVIHGVVMIVSVVVARLNRIMGWERYPSPAGAKERGSSYRWEDDEPSQEIKVAKNKINNKISSRKKMHNDKGLMVIIYSLFDPDEKQTTCRGNLVSEKRT